MDVEELKKKHQENIASWLRITNPARNIWRKAYDYVDGRMWSEQDKRQVLKSYRPALTFNRILPQVEMVCGMERGMMVDLVANPRGQEDKRLAEVASAQLKATADFLQLDRVKHQVFDDGTVCGLGVFEVLHRVECSEDLLWGDVVVSRINPLAFVFDPWATRMDMQDGKYMGKATWVSVEELKEEHPDIVVGSAVEWLQSGITQCRNANLGLGPSFEAELANMNTRMVRVLTVWDKRPARVSVVANTVTGQVVPVGSKEEGERLIAAMAKRFGKNATASLRLGIEGSETLIINNDTNEPMTDQEGRPLMFLDDRHADKHIASMASEVERSIRDQHSVITRKVEMPYFTKMVFWQVLQKGKTPFTDRHYPFVPYISRKFSDDPTSIQGLVAPVMDAQDEYTKRYNQLLAHLNSSAHSGWFNRKNSGADSQALQQMGSRSGVVVEYATVPPIRIEPTNISQGHFDLLRVSDDNIRTITGINREMVGMTQNTQQSGRAVQALQSGGTTILQARFDNWRHTQRDLASMLLSRIQQYYPVEKMRRIIGIAEASRPLGPGGTPLFQGMTTDQVMLELSSLKDTKFDLALDLNTSSPTQRQAQFEQAIQVAGLITSTGRQIGPATLEALVEMSDMPSQLENALKADAQSEVQRQVGPDGQPLPNAQNEKIQSMIANVRGGRAGGSEGVIGS